MHDAVPDNVGWRPVAQERIQVAIRRQVGMARQHVVVEQPQLQARGPGVDDQDARRHVGQVQFAISGSSSPCSRV